MALAQASGSVLVDNREAAALATRFLMGAGARRIACITGPADNLTAQNRLEGYRRGLRIPEDVNVVGFDELPWSLELHPGLSRVRQPAQEIGRQAARLLIDDLGHGGRPRHVVLEAELVVGSGTEATTSPCGALAS